MFIGGVEQSVAPIYSDKVSIEKERASDEMYYRTKLNGTVRFVGADFDLIEGQSLDTEMVLKVYGVDTQFNMEGSALDIEHHETLLVEGRFTKMDCTFNYDDKVCDVKVASIDRYERLVSGLSNEYDLISLAPERKPVTLTKRAILQVYRLRDTKITNVIGNMSYEVDVNSEVDLEQLTAEKLVSDYHFARAEEDVILAKLIVTNTGGVYDDLGDAAGIYEGRREGSNMVVLTNRDNNLYQLYEYHTSQGYYTLVLLYNNLPITHTDSVVGNVYVGSTPQVGRINFERGVTLQFVGLDTYSFTTKTQLPGIGTTSEFINTFSRVIMDKSVSGAYTIPTTDLAAHNLNYHYVKPYQITTIRRSFEVQDEPTKWGVDGDGKYFVRPTPSGLNNMIPIGWETWGSYSVWFECSTTIAQEIDTYNAEVVLNDAYPLYSAIQVLLNKIDDTITFEPTADYSQFLFGTLPSGAIPSHEGQSLYVTPITNVKRTYYDQAARKGMMTLKDVLDMLRSTMQLYWFIDDQSRLRIEHILWFKNGGSYSSDVHPLINITTRKSPMHHHSWGEGVNTISYDGKSLIKRYEFAWASETSEVFDGFAMDVKNKYSQGGKALSTKVSRFISDVDLVMSAPDALSDDLFALIGTKEVSGVQKCPIAYIGHLRGHIFLCPNYGMQNAYLSFFFLEQIYWVYNMGGSDVVPEGYYGASGSDGKIIAYGLQRVRKQSVKFPISTNNIGREGLIQTEKGIGQWVKATYTMEDGMVDMDLELDFDEDT